MTHVVKVPAAARAWQSGAVSETKAPDTRLQQLCDLVDEWLDWAQASDRLQVSVSKVRQLIREHQLAAVVPVAGEGQKVPAALIHDGVVVKGVPGVLTVLHDGGYDDTARPHLAVHPRRHAAGASHRRAAGEPRRRGEATRPGDGLLAPGHPCCSEDRGASLGPVKD